MTTQDLQAAHKLDDTLPRVGWTVPIVLGVCVAFLVSLLHFIGAAILFISHPGQILDPGSFGHVYYPTWLAVIVLCGFGFALSGIQIWRRSIDWAITLFLGCTLVAIVAPVGLLYVLTLAS